MTLGNIWSIIWYETISLKFCCQRFVLDDIETDGNVKIFGEIGYFGCFPSTKVAQNIWFQKEFSHLDWRLIGFSYYLKMDRISFLKSWARFDIFLVCNSILRLNLIQSSWINFCIPLKCGSIYVWKSRIRSNISLKTEYTEDLNRIRQSVRTKFQRKSFDTYDAHISAVIDSKIN